MLWNPAGACQPPPPPPPATHHLRVLDGLDLTRRPAGEQSQELSVYDGNGSSERGGNMLGQVCQTWAPCGSAFDIIVNGSVVFKINGPVCICDGPCCGDQVFSICDPSGQPVAAPGSVCGQAEIRKLGAKDFGDMVQQNFTDADNFGCTFPPGASAPVKSVILSAVFLLDFMFFENNAGAQQNQNSW